VLLAFDPTTGTWEITAMELQVGNARRQDAFSFISSSLWSGAGVGAPEGEGEDRDVEYGASHRRYVVSKRRAQGAEDAEKQVEKEFLDSRQRVERFSDVVARDGARERACTILRKHKEVRAQLEQMRTAPA